MLNVICFVCIVTDAATSIGIALMVIAILGFSITGVFSLLHFFYVTDTVRWPWPLMEMVYSQIWIILYLILSGFAFSVGLAPYIAAGVSIYVLVSFCIKYNVYKYSSKSSQISITWIQVFRLGRKNNVLNQRKLTFSITGNKLGCYNPKSVNPI